MITDRMKQFLADNSRDKIKSYNKIFKYWKKALILPLRDKPSYDYANRMESFYIMYRSQIRNNLKIISRAIDKAKKSSKEPLYDILSRINNASLLIEHDSIHMSHRTNNEVCLYRDLCRKRDMVKKLRFKDFLYEIVDIEQNNIVSDIRIIDEQCIIFITNPITLYHGDDEYCFGRYRVIIDVLSITKNEIYVYPEDTSIVVNDYSHPHISAYNKLCQGNASDTLRNSNNTLKLYDTIYTIVELLNNYNPQDVYQPIDAWKEYRCGWCYTPISSDEINFCCECNIKLCEDCIRVCSKCELVFCEDHIENNICERCMEEEEESSPSSQEKKEGQ